jgi:histidyl-tRNA synthetase
MVMETMQIRLTKGLIEEIKKLVDRDIYPSTSEAVRDAVRRLVLREEKSVVVESKKVQKSIEKELKKQLKKPTGTVDFYPKDMETRKTIFRKFMKVAEKYNFKQIETPAFESLNLLTKKEGEEITKQIFTLEKKGEEEFGLRFDITVPAARMFIEQQKNLPKPVKWYYLTRMWRYERPQQGRLREFYQYGTELFGSSKPEADAEIISLLIDSFKELGLTEKDFFIKLNNRKLLEGLLKDFIKEKIFETIAIIDKKNKIPEEEFNNELKKTGLDENKINKIKNIIEIKNIEEIKKYCNNDLATQGLEELKSVLNLLKNKKEFLRIDLSTARGLAYYTGIVFEAYDINERYRALAGGGRYDKMIEMFNGEPTPATGFGLGYATLYLLLKQKNLLPKIDLSPDYFIAIVNKEVKEKAIEITDKLRKNYKVEIDLMQRNLGNQFKYANKIKAKKVIIIGPDELKQNKIKIKDMQTGKEELKALSEL